MVDAFWAWMLLQMGNVEAAGIPRDQTVESLSAPLLPMPGGRLKLWGLGDVIELTANRRERRVPPDTSWWDLSWIIRMGTSTHSP